MKTSHKLLYLVASLMFICIMVVVIAENFGTVPLRKHCMSEEELNYDINHLPKNPDGSVSFKRAGFDQVTGCAYLIK